MATFVAEQAWIDPRAELDDDVYVGPFCVIGPQVRIGRGSQFQLHSRVKDRRIKSRTAITSRGVAIHFYHGYGEVHLAHTRGIRLRPDEQPVWPYSYVR